MLTPEGVIEGTTTQTGIFHLNVRVTDSEGAEATKAIELAAFPPSSNSPWEPIADYALRISPVSRLSCPDTEHCWAIQDGQVVATTDGGETWTSEQLSIPPATIGEAVYESDISCGDDHHCLLVGGGSQNGAPMTMFSTSNGGKTWSVEIPPTGITSFLGHISCSAASTCSVIAESSNGTEALLTTTNFAASWTSAPLPGNGTEAYSLGCNASDECAIAGQAETEGVVAITSDGGATWRSTYLGTDSYGSAAACGSLDDCVFSTGGGDARVEYSEDGGVTWHDGKLPSEAKYIAWMSCPDASHCWGDGGGTGGAIFATSDGGATWTEQRGLEYLGGTDISCPSTTSCFISGSAEEAREGSLNYDVVSTHDEGKEWAWHEVPLLGEAGIIACSSVEDCIVGSDYGNVALETSDGGRTWTATGQVDNPFLSSPCLGCLTLDTMVAASCAPGGPCFAAFIFESAQGLDSDASLYELVNGNWEPVSFPEGSYPYALSCVSAETCFVSASSGLYMTQDGGATWTNTGATSTEDAGGPVSCSDESHCVVSTAGVGTGKILITSNAGTTWQQATSGPSGASQLDCTSSEICWALSDSAVWRSEDGGNTWTRDSTSGVNSISCSDGQDCWAVGSYTGDGYEVQSTHDGGLTWADAGTAGDRVSLACPSTTMCLSASTDEIYKMPIP